MKSNIDATVDRGAGPQPRPYVSKSDFKVARECPVKLFYKKSRYPSLLDDNPYLALLADGGFMVGKMAQLLHPDGIAIETLSPHQACEETSAHLKQDQVTLFEAAIWVDHLLARFDVLRKIGGRFELIEVKSKGYDPKETSGHGRFFNKRGDSLLTEWRPYLEDVAFQRHVLQSAFPQAEINCFLLLSDKTKNTQVEGLANRFSLHRRGRGVTVDYHGDAGELLRENLLIKVPVDEEVAWLREEVATAERELVKLVEGGLKRPNQPIGYHCRDCEYRVGAEVHPNGFIECWGDLARPKPHLFDLFQLNAVKTKAKQRLADQLITNRKTSLFDVDPAFCTSSYGSRQIIQIKHTKADTEWVSPKLRQVIQQVQYPLHFIDFETSRMAVPNHRGMSPFEQVAFQWSCHTVASEGAVPVHREWINLEQAFPNFEFARTLRDVVGNEGTLLTWATHEKSTLRDIRNQIDRHRAPEPELKDWLERQTTQPNRILDLCKLAEKCYFHPAMAGKVSIKWVLPAIWRANPSLHAIPWFKPYYRVEEGRVLDPYKTLPSLEIYSQGEVVNEGTGAMRAYQEMLFGESRENPQVKETWMKLLLQYCRLDTVAMLIIWEHWRGVSLRSCKQNQGIQ